MSATSTFRNKLKRLDDEYLEPISEFFQAQAIKTGKRYVIKPLAQLVTEIVNASVNLTFDVADHFHKRYDNSRAKIKDRKGRQRVKDGIRQLRSIIIETSLDLSNPINMEQANEIYRRILFLDYAARMLRMSDEVNLLPAEFEQIKGQIKNTKGQIKNTKSGLLQLLG